MMKYYSMLLFSLAMINSLNAQKNLEQKVPMDQAIKHGQLANGLTYYICHNEHPKDRASFYIVQNVGALMENEEQNGLAHFLEHMAFNGTKHFPGKSIINTLEKHGVAFGSNINAYTAKNETVYNINNVPTNKKGLVDTCLLILHDWANGISLQTSEIDAERSVITEEWRTRRNADFRLMKQMAPALYNYSKYAERDVIGSLDVIQNFQPQTIKKFYHDWYRSDLQCIIVSGDVNVNKIETKIKELFSQIPAVENAETRRFYEIEPNEQPNYCLATDPEQRNSNISIYIRHRTAENEIGTHKQIRDTYITSLFNTMAHQRISNLIQTQNLPFFNAGISYSGLVRGYGCYNLTVIPKEDKDKEALHELISIHQDILKNGFRNEEFLMAKTNIIMSWDNYYEQKEHRNNKTFALACQSHYLYGSALPDIEYQYNFFKEQINTITVDEIKSAMKKWYADKNWTIVVSGPKDADKKYLSKNDVLSIVNNANETTQFKDQLDDTNKVLLENIPIPGEIESKTKIKQFAGEKWVLSNGATVIYKYCNHRPNRVNFKAKSLGGSSLVKNEDVTNASVLNKMMGLYGLGNHDATSLKNMMVGKDVAIGIHLKELSENINGSCHNKDFETMMQLVYMNFKQPRFDKRIHDLYMTRSYEALNNNAKTYAQILQDSVTMIMHSYQPRVHLYNEDYLNSIDIQKIESIYKDRFQDASDFTFYIIGDISKKKAEKMAKQYIGSLSSTYRNETFKDLGSHFPADKTMKAFKFKMAEPKAGAVLIYRCDMPFNQKNKYCYNILVESLKLRFTEEIREKEGGTYGVQVAGHITRLPQSYFMLNIQFECDPARVEELKAKIYNEIDKLLQNGIPKEDIKKTIALLKKMKVQRSKNNKYWQSVLEHYIEHNEDITSKAYFDDIINSLTLEDVHSFTKSYFKDSNLIDIHYKPE